MRTTTPPITIERLRRMLQIRHPRALAAVGAATGNRDPDATKPFSIVAVCACKTHDLVVRGLIPRTTDNPSATRSWMSCVPEAWSSIKIVATLRVGGRLLAGALREICSPIS
jgi:hypothetical protein